jgi:hypothetical protein
VSCTAGTFSSAPRLIVVASLAIESIDTDNASITAANSTGAPR